MNDICIGSQQILQALAADELYVSLVAERTDVKLDW